MPTVNNSGVYLLACPYSGTTMLKIGFAKDVHKRIKTHKTSNPLLEVIGYIYSEDYKWLEKHIHQRCAKYKYSTEWFFYRDEIINYFKEHEQFRTV